MKAEKILLAILDGWGHGPKPEVSAITQAHTPFMDSLYEKYPNTELVTYGELVGLPEGQMGNSEVGHLNIGAGRVVYQELARINKAIREGQLGKNSTLQAALTQAKQDQKSVHLMGLVSDGGVHSHINHLKALSDICAEMGLEKVFIHAFTDGRDTAPTGGINYLADLQKHIQDQPTQIATVVGRYYAMDRDKRWERIKVAYELLVNNTGEKTTDLISTIQARYDKNETDEFLQPICCVDEQAAPIAAIQNGDLLICFNFRTDRPRQISEVLTQSDMEEHGMKKLDLTYVTMTRYDERFQGVQVMFDKQNIQQTLGQILAEANKTQVRIAETEKYPHVTFFFNGGREEPFEGEKRILVNSPKVATYDLQPEMSAPEITEAITAEIEANQPHFICLNYANTDMVGHTGDFEAAKKAAETVDDCMKTLISKALEHDYATIIIADHGNSDFMINEDGSPNTAHTKNPVPCILVHPAGAQPQLKDGKLADLAPTILTMMDIAVPEAMDGDILLGATTAEV